MVLFLADPSGQPELLSVPKLDIYLVTLLQVLGAVHILCHHLPGGMVVREKMMKDDGHIWGEEGLEQKMMIYLRND